MRTCLHCGERMAPPTREDVPYNVGLPGIVLRGALVHRCECGEFEVDVHDVDGLHADIAHEIARRAPDLTGPEIRFLRKYLGWNQANFAKFFHTDKTTISKWENGHQRMSPPSQQLLALRATLGPEEIDYERDVRERAACRRLPFETDRVRMSA